MVYSQDSTSTEQEFWDEGRCKGDADRSGSDRSRRDVPQVGRFPVRLRAASLSPGTDGLAMSGRKCAVVALAVAGVAIVVRFVHGALNDVLDESSVLKLEPHEHHSVVDYVDMAINLAQGLRH